ncbi:MAG: hypothetical protein MJK04_37280 [Psychrosphaera sp.]|nr:hypothetical protein [Psychrosphaera sp.]
MRHHTFTQSLKMLLGISVLMCFSSFAAVPDPFTGWGKAGYNTDQYQTGFLEKLKDSGRQLGFIKSLDPSKRGFGTLMRTAGIEQFKGKRIELVTYIKTSKARSAGAWFRVNGEKVTLAFDNMSDRRIRGTKDWQKVSLVLDIPEDAVSVSYGILLEGDGKVWFQKPTFDIVDLTVKTTERSRLKLDDLQMENKHFQAVNGPDKTPRVRNSSNVSQGN